MNRIKLRRENKPPIAITITICRNWLHSFQLLPPPSFRGKKTWFSRPNWARLLGVTLRFHLTAFVQISLIYFFHITWLCPHCWNAVQIWRYWGLKLHTGIVISTGAHKYLESVSFLIARCANYIHPTQKRVKPKSTPGGIAHSDCGPGNQQQETHLRITCITGQESVGCYCKWLISLSRIGLTVTVNDSYHWAGQGWWLLVDVSLTPEIWPVSQPHRHKETVHVNVQDNSWSLPWLLPDPIVPFTQVLQPPSPRKWGIAFGLQLVDIGSKFSTPGAQVMQARVAVKFRDEPAAASSGCEFPGRRDFRCCIKGFFWYA